jgi:hypothetical protein
MSRTIAAFALLLWVAELLPHTAAAQHGFTVTPVAEKTIEQLPAGPLLWSVQSFRTIGQAKAAEGPTSLAAEYAKLGYSRLGQWAGRRRLPTTA